MEGSVDDTCWDCMRSARFAWSVSKCTKSTIVLLPLVLGVVTVCGADTDADNTAGNGKLVVTFASSTGLLFHF